MHCFLFLGASTSMRDNLHGNTPLHWALLAKNLQAVSQLVTKFNADINAVNLQGQSCLDLFKNHVKKAREARNAGSGSNSKTQQHGMASQEFMFFPRKVAEKFEAHLPKNWLADAQKVAKSKYRACPSFIVTFFADPKVSKKIQ